MNAGRDEWSAFREPVFVVPTFLENVHFLANSLIVFSVSGYPASPPLRMKTVNDHFQFPRIISVYVFVCILQFLSSQGEAFAGNFFFFHQRV